MNGPRYGIPYTMPEGSAFIHPITTIKYALTAGGRIPLREPVTVTQGGWYRTTVHSDGTATLTRLDEAGAVKFDWPCDLRIAHGPHVLVTEEIHDAGGRLLATHAEDCPGVEAHPDTMIGRVAKSVTK